MSNNELRALLDDLRAVEKGRTFETHEVRAILRRAMREEFLLEKRLKALSGRRRVAQWMFLLGWPTICP
jgi:hypothetical protein